MKNKAGKGVRLGATLPPPPREPSEMSGDIFGCQDWGPGWGVVWRGSWHPVCSADKYPTMHMTPTRDTQLRGSKWQWSKMATLTRLYLNEDLCEVRKRIMWISGGKRFQVEERANAKSVIRKSIWYGLRTAKTQQDLSRVNRESEGWG